MEKRGKLRRERIRAVTRRNQYQISLLISVLALAFAMVCTILTLLSRPKDSSRAGGERSGRPGFSLEGLLDGSWLQGLSDAFSEQFLGREGWINAKQTLDRTLGIQEQNGVYLGADGQLLMWSPEISLTNARNTTQAINRFAAANDGLRVYLALIPNSSAILSDRLPKGAPVSDQSSHITSLQNLLSERICPLDVTDALCSHKDEYLYFRTDPRWTSLGARYAFEAMAEALELNPVSSYQIYTVSNSFQGPLCSQSGHFELADNVELYVPEPNTACKVVYGNSGAVTATLYSPEALDGADHYDVFLGGDQPRVDVFTTADTGRRLLIFKSSFANCFVQFLTPYFEQIILVDPCTCREDPAALITENRITDVLFLYDLDTFLSDTRLIEMLSR